MKTKIITATVIVFGIVGLFVWGSTRGAPSAERVQGVNSKAEKSDLIVSEPVYNFGTILMRDGLVEHSFVITNPTELPVTVSAMATSCMCTTAYLEGANGVEKGPFGMVGHGGVSYALNEIISPGETRTVRAVFDPNAHGPAGVGPVDRFIMLSDSAGGTLAIEFKGVVRP